MKHIEYCRECDEPVGIIGKVEVEHYDMDNDGKGPYCLYCLVEIQKQRADENGQFGVGA